MMSEGIKIDPYQTVSTDFYAAILKAISKVHWTESLTPDQFERIRQHAAAIESIVKEGDDPDEFTAT